MLVIGIAGGSGSGKTTVVKAITRQLNGRVVVIPQDSYYKDSSHLPMEERHKINFDHPDAIDWKLLCQQIRELRDQMNIKIFVDADDDDRVVRIILRDIAERGRNIDTAVSHYCETVKPMHLQFIEPSKRYADIIVPQGGHNQVAIDIITTTVEQALHRKQ